MRLDHHDKHKIKIALIIVFFSLWIYAFFMKIDSVIRMLATLWTVATPFIAGLFLAYIVNMPMVMIENRILGRVPLQPKAKRILSLVLAYTLVIAGITFVLVSVLPQLIFSLQSLINRIPPFVQNLSAQLNDFEPIKPFLRYIEAEIANVTKEASLWSYLKNFFISGDGTVLLSRIVGTITSFFSSLLIVFISFIFSLYALSAKETLSRQAKELLYSTFSEKFCDGLMYVSYTSYDNFYNFFTGQFVEAIVLGVMCFVGMALLKLPYAIVISVLIAFCALIPMIGAIIGGFVGCLLLLIDSPANALCFLIFIVTLQQFDGNLIYPRIVGKSIGLPAMWVLVAITIGGSFFGILGMLIFVPIASTAYDLLTDYKTRRLASRNISIETK